MNENINYIYPSLIDNTNFSFIQVDDKYIASIVINDYPRTAGIFEITEAIPKNVEYDLSMYISKQDTKKVLKKLTYYISSTGTELKTANENQVDIDVVEKTKSDAKMLRKDIQLNNEEVFFLNIYITFYSNNKNILMENMKKFQSLIYSRLLMSSITNFRHLDSYLLNLPQSNFENRILKTTYRNITTTSLSNIFPFYTKTVFDEYGVIFGYTLRENKLCNIDIFNSRYLNSNICIFGSSGSGKSYFTKLLVIRHFLSGKYQYIIDPEGEYINISRNLNSNFLDIQSNTNKMYINIFDISEIDVLIYLENVIEYKINEVLDLIINLSKIEEYEQIEELKNEIKNLYIKFRIVDFNDVFLTSDKKDKIYITRIVKDTSYFPTILDLIKNIKSKKLKNVLKDTFINRFSIFSDHTNFDMLSKLVVFNFSKVGQEESIVLIDYFVNVIEKILFMKKNKKINQKSIIYIDEIWKYISLDTKTNLSERIFKLFKTIRKQNGSIISITQDISDFFSYKNSIYGKSILNNSSFKVFFKLEYSDNKILEKINILDDDILNSITTLNKGQALLSFENSTSHINIKTNSFEKEIIEEELY